jgi:DNA-binding transcriptional ArsR family regulator
LADLDDLGIDPSVFQAMSHPLRVQILGDLSLPGAVWSPSDYAEKIGKPLGTVSYHFRELDKYGLVECIKERQVRGSVEHFYRAKKSALFTNTPAWSNLPGTARTRVAAKALNGYVQVSGRAIAAGAFERRDNAHFSWGTMRIDEEGWDQMQLTLAQTLQAMFDIEREAIERMGKGGTKGFDATYGLGGFESPSVEPKADSKEEKPPS